MVVQVGGGRVECFHGGVFGGGIGDGDGDDELRRRGRFGGDS